MSFQVPNITPAELDQLLTDVETQGAGIHTAVNRVDAFHGVITAHPKIGFFSVTVNGSYALYQGTLTVSADRGESQIQQQLFADMARIRGQAS